MEEMVTPFPRPETTPPVTTMYFIIIWIRGSSGSSSSRVVDSEYGVDMNILISILLV